MSKRTILLLFLIVLVVRDTGFVSSSMIEDNHGYDKGSAATATTTTLNGRIRGENGKLSLTIAVPLTCYGTVVLNNGWQHMAAALLAVDHFNEKNPVIVQDLQTVPYLRECAYEMVNITVLDTGNDNGHSAMKQLLADQYAHNPPDAIAGPYDEQPALELSVLATGLQTPLVAFRGMDHDLLLPDKHPFYSQINSDLYGDMEFVGDYLLYRRRTNYIAVLYTTDDRVLQRMEILRGIIFPRLNITHSKMYSYQSADKLYFQRQEYNSNSNNSNSNGHKEYDRGIREAVWKIAQTGYRTIVFLTGTPDLDTVEVGQAAHDYQLDRGDHFWILPGGLDASSTNKEKILFRYRDSPIGGFLRGSSYLSTWDTNPNTDQDLFTPAFLGQNASFVQRLRDLNPVPNFFTENFYYINFSDWDKDIPFPPNDIFQQFFHVAEGVTRAYDATMAIGIGACLALHKTNINSTSSDGANSTARGNIDSGTGLTGEMHLDGIRSVDFKGVTGPVRFRNLPGNPGSRQGNSIHYGVLNLLPYGAEGPFGVRTDFLNPQTQQWEMLEPHVFSDGTSNPPKLLRSIPEQNYLEPGVRAFGISLASIAFFCIIASTIWVAVHRHHSAVIAAQPPFLYVLCFGSTFFATAILSASFDEGSGWADDNLDAACTALPWLLAMGHIVTYSALFTKLWRVNKVLQFKGSRFKVRHLLRPALCLIVAATVILAVWTAIDDFGWERYEIDELSGESIGRCKGNYSIVFLVPVGVLCLIPTVLTGIMAWKTNDVDTVYSESKWIFSLILVQIQVIIVGAPIVAILQEVSTNGRYIGLTLIVWTFPMTNMGLIMLPKILAVKRETLGILGSQTQPTQPGSRVPDTTSSPNEQQERPSETSIISSRIARSPGNLNSPPVMTVTME